MIMGRNNIADLNSRLNQRRLKNQKDSAEHGTRGGGWEIVYSGFILILLSFFIMLCSFASMEGSKISRFVASFNNAVNILSGGIRTDPGKFYLGVKGETVEVSSEIAKIRKNIAGLADELGLSEEISFVMTKEGLITRLPDSAIFNVGVATISQKSKILLNKMGKIISETDYPVRIEGHTDDIPIKTAKYPSNWELSTTRAVNVLRYFIENLDISPERLSAAGFGEHRPLFPNTTAQNRAKNRRVEFIFIAGRPENNAES